MAARFADTYTRVDGGEWLFSAVTMRPWCPVPLAQGRAGADRHRMRL